MSKPHCPHTQTHTAHTQTHTLSTQFSLLKCRNLQRRLKWMLAYCGKYISLILKQTLANLHILQILHHLRFIWTFFLITCWLPETCVRSYCEQLELVLPAPWPPTQRGLFGGQGQVQSSWCVKPKPHLETDCCENAVKHNLELCLCCPNLVNENGLVHSHVPHIRQNNILFLHMTEVKIRSKIESLKCHLAVETVLYIISIQTLHFCFGSWRTCLLFRPWFGFFEEADALFLEEQLPQPHNNTKASVWPWLCHLPSPFVHSNTVLCGSPPLSCSISPLLLL